MKQDANEIPKSLSGTLKFSNPVSPVKEETKHTPEFDYEFVNDALNFYFNYSQKELLKNTLGDIERKNLEAIRQKSLYHMSNNDYYSAMLKENQELKALCREVLTAREQYQFFVNGYANGSASISEANHAATVEHEAYSKLWDYLKSKAQ